MLRKKRTVTFVSCLALLILFLFGANSSLAQTPQTPSEKPIEEAVAPARLTSDSTTSTPVAAATTSTPDETAATKPSVESATVGEPAKATTNVTPVAGPAPMQAQCKRNLKADVVAVAQPIFLNRLGAVIPGGMVFALKRDTVGGVGSPGTELEFAL